MNDWKRLVAGVVGVLAVMACARADADRPAQQSTSAHETLKRSAWLEGVKAISISALRPIGQNVERTPSGVVTKVIRKGFGTRRATMGDAVVLYSQVYDSTGRGVARGQNLIGDPADDLNQAGREALSMMVEGEVRRIWFPDSKSPNAVKVTDYEIVWLSPQGD